MFDVKGLFDPIVAIVNKIIPDKAAAAAAASQLQLAMANGQLQQELDSLVSVTTAQSDIDKVEAGSNSIFVAGWRPFVGWVCATGLAYVAIIEPLARFIATVGFKYAGAFPVIDTNLTMQVLLGMLGMGAMRSYDKSQGTATKAVK
jgi:hypothetical protein